MICSFTLYLKPLEYGKKIGRYINYDPLSPQFKESGFSSEEIKKIVISNFLTKDRVIEDKNYSLRISSIDENIFFLSLLFSLELDICLKRLWSN